ncbi:MAG: helix-turn-helix domain-containing protein [Clostridia bacterium]
MSLFGNLYEHDELPTRANHLYMYLKDRSNKYGECWPAIKTIARDTSMSVSTVKRAIADLVGCGLITKEKRYRDNGSLTSNNYFLKR